MLQDTQHKQGLEECPRSGSVEYRIRKRETRNYGKQTASVPIEICETEAVLKSNTFTVEQRQSRIWY